MIESLPLGLIYSLLKDALRALQGRRRSLTPEEVVKQRQQWKPLFEREIRRAHTNELRKDIILRDVRRIDSYPHADNKAKGISPWFRCGLMATYHKGILVGLWWGELKKNEQGHEWRCVDYRSGETGDLRVVLIGRIPYENIEVVDWNGDEYYSFPHVYCHFDARKTEPYETLVFCAERRYQEECPSYVEVAPYEQVRQLSKRLGISPTF